MASSRRWSSAGSHGGSMSRSRSMLRLRLRLSRGDRPQQRGGVVGGVEDSDDDGDDAERKGDLEGLSSLGNIYECQRCLGIDRREGCSLEGRAWARGHTTGSREEERKRERRERGTVKGSTQKTKGRRGKTPHLQAIRGRCSWSSIGGCNATECRRVQVTMGRARRDMINPMAWIGPGSSALEKLRAGPGVCRAQARDWREAVRMRC